MDAPSPRDLWSLVKPRIVALLCVTGAFAILAAGGRSPAVVLAFVVAGGCVAASAAAVNCWYDRNLDRRMERTADRPLPGGRLDHRIALAFAVALLVVGTGVGLRTLPLRSVAHMLLGFASYVGLYTILLKRRHWLGVVLGGSAGSFPVLAGWAAVRPIGAEAVLLALVVFAWTPAHAWSLAYVYRSDFEAVGVPTLPVVASMPRLQRGIRISVWSTLAVAACAIPFASAPYAVAALVGGALFVLGFRQFLRTGAEAAAVRAFFTSNLFLAALFVAWGMGGVVPDAGASASALVAAVLPALFVGLWIARPALRGVPASAGEEWLTLYRRLRAGARQHIRDNDHRDLQRRGD